MTMYRCAICGDSMDHNCIGEDLQMHKRSNDLLTLFDQLERLTRENEQLRIKLDILRADKAMERKDG